MECLHPGVDSNGKSAVIAPHCYSIDVMTGRQSTSPLHLPFYNVPRNPHPRPDGPIDDEDYARSTDVQPPRASVDDDDDDYDDERA